MKKEVYEKIQSNKGISINEIAEQINYSDLDVLKTVEELTRDGYVKMDDPVPLNESNSCSCYYSVTDRKFVQK